MTDRVAECIYPERKSCRGCSQSLNPARYDGGCMLYYGRGRAVSLPESGTETAAQTDTKNRELDRGGGL